MNADLSNTLFSDKINLYYPDCAKPEERASIIDDKLQLRLYISRDLYEFSFLLRHAIVEKGKCTSQSMISSQICGVCIPMILFR